MRCCEIVRTALTAGILVACTAITETRAQSIQPGGAQASQKVWTPGEVHPGFTRIYVHVFKTGMGHEHAVAGRVKEGVIHLGATQNAGRVVADLTSFVADPESARKVLGLPGETDPDTQKKVNANMLGPDVLDVATFSTATGNITSARLLQQRSATGLPRYLLEGDLTLHGVTKKMSVVAEAVEKNGWVRLRGHVSLRQSDFGMQPYTAMLGTIGVADQLEIYGEGYIVKENDIPPPVAPAGPPSQ
ncbi:MAG: YceI family protein [Thermoguttaceae bacterium]